MGKIQCQKIKFYRKDVLGFRPKKYPKTDMIRNYLGKEGYFSNYRDFAIYFKGRLTSVEISVGCPFLYHADFKDDFFYFIPKDKVTEIRNSK